MIKRAYPWPDSPLAILQVIERRCQQVARTIVPQPRKVPTWQGLMVEIAGEELLVPLADVAEVINFPPTLTRVPGSERWITGVANVRGTLMPVIDTQCYLQGPIMHPTSRNRMLVVRDRDFSSALLIGQAISMRRFPVTERIERRDLGRMPGLLPEPGILYGYRADDRSWPVIDLKLFLRPPGLLLEVIAVR